jgi:addiction module HigA family antidote
MPAKNKKSKAQTPIHPGLALEKLLNENHLTVYRLSKEIKIDPSLLSKIIKGDRPISPLVSIALGKFFGVDEAYWISLQVQYDLGITGIKYNLSII